MKPLRFILVGLGARSRIWRRVIAEHADCRLVGVAELDSDRLARVRGELGEASDGEVAAGGTLEHVAGQVEADIALLCTPPAGRDAQIEAACGAGLAILAEKPLADTLEGAEAYVTAAERAGVPLAVGLNFRYLAVTRALKELFAADRLGPPEFGRFTYERWRDGRQPHLNSYPLTMAHPMLWEQSIHHFDLMRFVYDAEPVRISARTFNPSWSMYEGDANVGALITFTGGIEVNYQGTWAGNWQTMGFEWRTDCARGVARQRDMFGALEWARRDDPEPTPVDLGSPEPWLDDARGLLEDFVGHFRDGRPLPCSGRDHLESLRMVDACIRSSASCETVELHPA
ncbi:MAG: Gfo/Idh/MocA family oxidoreductase [Gemmatimonadetes bacterium]|nr:Gfo/Idh/MocA family oxidoreductase [Gemmatimonadota bacterium]